MCCPSLRLFESVLILDMTYSNLLSLLTSLHLLFLLFPNLSSPPLPPFPSSDHLTHCLLSLILQVFHVPISRPFIAAVNRTLYVYMGEFNQNVKLSFQLSFVHFCEESRVAIALVFYGYFVVLFFLGHAVSCGSGCV